MLNDVTRVCSGTAGAAGTAMKGHNRETEELIGANGGGRSRDVERNLALYEVRTGTFL